MKALIFDMGGVVLLPGGSRRLREEISARFKIPLEALNSAWNKSFGLWECGKITERDFLNRLNRDLGNKLDLNAVKLTILNEQKLNNDLLPVIKELQSQYLLLALTNHAREWFEPSKLKYSLGRIFSRIYTSYELGVQKPDPRIYNILLREEKLNPDDCLFIDDYDANVAAARDLGMRAIKFTGVNELVSELKLAGINVNLSR